MTIVSEEIKNPKKNIPLGMILSIIVVTVLYTLITFVITGTIEPEVFKSLLKVISKPVAGKARISTEEIASRLMKRQEEYNTALSDFLTIPHIIIDGKDRMFLTIIRAKKGIKFTENEENVKAVFILGGTEEKRVLHLRTLASIATLVGLKDFQEKWLNAGNETEIKNIMILNERKRFNV